MHIHFYHHHSWDETPPWAVDLKNQGALILKKLETLMAAIDDLQAAVAAEDTVIDSAVTLLNGIPALIAAAGTDPAKLAALQSDIQTRTASLAAAILVATPAPSTTAPAVTPAAATEAATASVAKT